MYVCSENVDGILYHSIHELKNYHRVWLVGIAIHSNKNVNIHCKDMRLIKEPLSCMSVIHSIYMLQSLEFSFSTDNYIPVCGSVKVHSAATVVITQL